VPKAERAYRADPYSYAQARALVDQLGLSEPLAITLVRRGYGTPEEARDFLEASQTHDPSGFRAIDEICERLFAAADGGRRITVHGDFDVDGVCATAIAVSTLRSVGADCDWLIPDRLADGYGLSGANLERLAARGTSVLLTVDCGITAAAEVERAKELGMEVIVTDHHQPGDELPDCPLLHPSLSGYPFSGLCGTAVAWKLAAALRRRDGQAAEASDRDLDLVALATVADLVPLVGENRALVRRGLATLRSGQRPGLRALIAESGCELSRLDEGDIAFRLAPRINAAGRLYRADAGVELLLTADQTRAGQIATELERANRDRQQAEREVENAAEAVLRALPSRLREAPALVLGGEGWHPGVVGIVASRLVERHYKPVVLVSLEPDGSGRGSGRGIPGFDLLAGLRACAEHLTRFGGHRAAAGLELRSGALEAFRDAFVAHAGAVLGPEGARRVERIDAIVGGAGIGLELAEDLERLAPFGVGNPGIRLMVPSARLRDVRTIGEGKHARFSLHSGSHRALGVAFGQPSLGVGEDEAVDASVRLEVNQWNGSIEPRLVLRDIYAVDEGGAAETGHKCECRPEEWWERFDDALAEETVNGPAQREERYVANGRPARREIARNGTSPAAVLAELVSSGERVLALGADASRRAGLAAGPAGLARFGGAGGLVVCGRCGREALETAAGWQRGSLILGDYQALSLRPSLADAFEHVVLIDPPPSASLRSLASRPGPGGGYLHPAWGQAERSFALSVLEDELGLRMQLRSLFRGLRGRGTLTGEVLRDALRGAGRHPRSPELAARCVRVLRELALVQEPPDRATRGLGVLSSERIDLERSAAYRGYRARYEECKRYLESPKPQ
jgi:single-stranded-DNA-specific exonuclease